MSWKQRNRCSRSDSSVGRKTGLKRFADVPRAIFETGELFQERQRDLADRAVSLFRDDQLRFAGLLRAGVLIFLVNFRPDEQSNQIRILFDRARFAQIA